MIFKKIYELLIKFMPLSAWLISILLILVAIPWLNQAGLSMALVGNELLAGQLMYVFSKICGLWGLLLLGCQGIYGLTPIAMRRRFNFTLKRTTHPMIGLTILFLLACHITGLIWSVEMRMGDIPWRFLGVNFTHGYYVMAMSLGAICFWTLMFALIIPAFVCSKCKRKIHRTGVMVFLIAWFHCMLIGSETRAPIIFVIFTVQALWIISLVIHKFLSKRNIRLGHS